MDNKVIQVLSENVERYHSQHPLAVNNNNDNDNDNNNNDNNNNNNNNNNSSLRALCIGVAVSPAWHETEAAI
jgi:hypothetical protein